MSGGVTETVVPAEVIGRFGIESATERPIGYWVGHTREHYWKFAPVTTEAARRLRREASILARVEHPAVPRADDRTDEVRGWAVLVTRRMPGRPVLELRDELTATSKESVLSQVEDALRHLNSRGVLHADVNAGNVLWDGASAALIDFEEARLVVPPLPWRASPDRIGGPPCSAGPDPYGYDTVHCLNALRAWLFEPEFDALGPELTSRGIWGPSAKGNTCLPETTPSDGSTYQTVRFGRRVFSGQRDPLLRFRYLLARNVIPFRDARVLDVGCNFGQLSNLLDLWEIDSYVGLEIDEGYWRIAGQLAQLNGMERAQFILGDVCDTSVVDRLAQRWRDGVDVVVCQSVYHHLTDKLAFWNALDRLRCRWLVFEGPVDQPLFLSRGTWPGEQALAAERGFELAVESWENDYPGRVLGVFRRRAPTTPDVR